MTREVRRYYPLTPNTLYSVVTRSFEFMEYRIPVGVKVIGCIDATHHSRAAFDDPDRFDPVHSEDKREPSDVWHTAVAGPRRTAALARRWLNAC